MVQSESIPPPIYSQQDPDDTITRPDVVPCASPQILIIPTVDAINFQKGYLGAEGERAAIEGELQIKTTDADRWNKVLVSHSIP